MNNLRLVLLGLCIAALSTSCKKEKNSPEEEEKIYGYVNYRGLTVASNPSNYNKSTTITEVSNYWAELSDVNGKQQLKIYWGDQYNNTVITVDFTGVANYSSDNTNLSCSINAFNGNLNPSYTFIKSIKATGGYMEILSYQNGIISGNIRFIVGYREPISNSYKYTGIDDGNFEIKLR